jgi:hypothetical protein
MIVGQQKDITRRPSIQKLRDGKSEGYRKALDENGREVWYSCSDALDTRCLSTKRKNANKVRLCQNIFEIQKCPLLPLLLVKVLQWMH